LKEENPELNIKLYNAARSDTNDIVTEIFKSKAILVGSPTINKGILHSISSLMEMAKGLKFKQKKAAAFGCYGWSGESVGLVNQLLEEAGFELISKEGLKVLWNPDQEAVEAAKALGREVGKAVK
jgi:anaerobic nitric oxide reductase flavorubredoxin